MARLADGIAHVFDRVELFARGAEGARKAAEEALARGRPLDAREQARALLARVPGSPLGLALLADAAEDAWLDAEAAEALAGLAKHVPWRADVWLRLGLARERAGLPEAREALERATSAPEAPEAVRRALLALCDRDLAAGDPTRALRWLDRVAPRLTPGPDDEVALRRAEVALGRGDTASASTLAGLLGEAFDITGRTALVRARLALAEGHTAWAVDHALRAFLLDAPGASAFFASLIAATHDAVVVSRARAVVMDTESASDPAWKAAFAFAEGRTEDARQALADGIGAGDAQAEQTLLRLAVEARDLRSLSLLSARTAKLPVGLGQINAAQALLAAGNVPKALDALDGALGVGEDWAAEIRDEALAQWLSFDAIELPWDDVCAELYAGARALERLDRLAAVEALSAMRARPLCVAVVGEFNAGKSTFLNALLGVDVAPTGVIPTTATLHWVAWAAEPFARIVMRGHTDRVVTHAGLKAALRAVVDEGNHVERVYIYAPIERLKRIELLDTPGFNAPDPEHLAAARTAFDEAHVALWLLDGAAPLKDSERRILREAEALGVPVQVLINKADRVTPGQEERVLAHVEEGLAESGVSTLGPPRLFSARLALAGRLGDEAALSRSGFAEVEALLAERVVDASRALRERALRRRALQIVRELAREAGLCADSELSQIAEQTALREAALGAAERLKRDALALVERVSNDLQQARRDLARDLVPVQALREEQRRLDPSVRAYVEERAVTRIAAPLAEALARAVERPTTEAEITAVRAVIVGAVAALDGPDGIADRLERVIVAAALACADALRAEARHPLSGTPFAILARRLSAFERALLRANRGPSSGGEGERSA